jgi:fucose 4-O-acetylase-like acetyltransferase
MSQTLTLDAPPAAAEPVRTAALEAPAISTASNPASPASIAVGTLRAVITVLVVAHHAVLAYNPFAPPPTSSLLTQPRFWGAFPVVDSQRWGASGLFTSFNDMFFMALMFFLSGLFVWASLQRKGAGTFLRDRARRLGIPFVVAAAVIAPLAYYPAYLQTGGSGMAGFWRQWLALGNWPAGPAWFLWVLLAFDTVAAGLFLLAPRWGERLGRLAAGARERPARFFGLLAAVSAVAYIPMEIFFNGFAWASFGPFFVQTSRILHYAVYFFAGAGVGAYGLERGLLAVDGKLARRWLRWSIASVVVFGVALAVIIAAISAAAHPPVPRSLEIAGDLGFVLSCAASGFAFLALFVRFVKRTRIFDSLRDNAFGIYLVHYAFVSWLQYALLPAGLPGFIKAAAVTLGALALSWGTTAALRRIPVVARVL